MSDLRISAASLARAAIGTSLTTIWSALLGLISAPIMIRNLHPASYGVFALITLVSGYVTNLEFGFGHATIRFVAVARKHEDPAEEAAVIGNSLLVFGIAAALATALTFFGAPFIVTHFAHGPAHLQHAFVESVRIGAFTIGASLLTSLAQALLQARGRLQLLIYANWVGTSMMSIGAVTLVLTGHRLVAVIWFQLAMGVAGLVFFYGCLVRDAVFALAPRINRASFKEMARFAIFVMVAGIGSQLTFQGPPTVLAGYATTAQLAAFSVPRTVLQQLDSVVGSASFGFLPFASGASVDVDRSGIKKIFLANVRLTLLMMAPVVFFLVAFAHPVLKAWVGASFAHEAARPLQWLAISSLFWGSGPAPADLARGFGRSGVVAIYTVAGGAVSIALALLVVPAHHAAGAAFAMCLGGAIVTVPFLVLVSRAILDVRALELLRALAGPLCALTLAAGLNLGGAAISETFVGAVATGVVATAIYVAVTVMLILDERERSVLRSIVGGGRSQSAREAAA